MSSREEAGSPNEDTKASTQMSQSPDRGGSHSQTKQLFQLYELLATLNRRLDIELQRTIDTIEDYDERDTLQKYLRVCIPR